MGLVAGKIIATRKGQSMKHKNLLVGGILTATLLGGGAFALSASAASNSNDTLASKIATKFNLKQEDVQKVVDESRTEMHTQHKAEMRPRQEARLAQAVKDGKLTEDQKTKILQFIDSQESFFQSLVDKTDEERKQAMKTHREEVKKWATDNGIDPQYVMLGGHMGHGPDGHGIMTGGDKTEQN